MLSLFIPLLLLLATVNANLNLSHLRVKRIGHASHAVSPRTLHARHVNARDDAENGDFLSNVEGMYLRLNMLSGLELMIVQAVWDMRLATLEAAQQVLSTTSEMV
jgi:hypothetical protein